MPDSYSSPAASSASPPPDAPAEPGVPSYRAEAVRDDEQWHVTVQNLDDHPDRGEVDALVVTVTSCEPGDGLPPRDVERTLHTCGFHLTGQWKRHGDRWVSPCAESHAQASAPEPPAPK